MNREHENSELERTSLEDKHSHVGAAPNEGEQRTAYWDVRALLQSEGEDDIEQDVVQEQEHSPISDVKRGAPIVRRRSWTCRQPQPAFVKARR